MKQNKNNLRRPEAVFTRPNPFAPAAPFPPEIQTAATRARKAQARVQLKPQARQRTEFASIVEAFGRQVRRLPDKRAWPIHAAEALTWSTKRVHAAAKRGGRNLFNPSSVNDLAGA